MVPVSKLAANLAFALPTLAEPLHFSVAEMGLLTLFCLASAGLFAVRLAPIARNILRSKPEPGFRLAPLGRRTWVFFSEVLCQSKVIQQRPLPGLAHAFVFWGFLAFALVTLNHLLTGLRLGVLQHTGFVGTFYFGFAGLWAVLVAISIAGLFVRRFFVRPRWLGTKVSVESGIIAGLIFVLMVTYLAAYTVPENGLTIKILWWMHTLALLAFLPLIPHTKHLHLVLSPLTVFLKRERFSDIPPLAEETESAEANEDDPGDVGLLTGRDLTQVISLQAYSCVECGRCTEHCPAATTGKVLNPKEIALGVRTYLNSEGPASTVPLLNELRDTPANFSPDNPAANWLSMEAAFQCTTCGACEFQCPVGVQHLPILVGLRRGAVNTGAWEDKHGTRLFLALERQGNALGLPPAQRDKFLTDAALPIFDGTQEYCLWLGCMGSYDPRGREIIADFARIMRHLGTSFGVLKKEKCTGDPARRLGNDLVFNSLAEQGSAAFAKANVKKLVSICPHCVRTIAEDWATSGFAAQADGSPISIEHHSEFLARHAAQLPQAALPQRLKPLNGAGPDGGAEAPPLQSNNAAAASPLPSEKVVYHDPCYLGRYRNSYEQPREVIQHALGAGGKLLEADRHHERSFCCGAGGGLAFLGDEPQAKPGETSDHGNGEAARISHVRTRELLATGAQTIATACPFCNTMFRDAAAVVGSDQPPQLLDIAQLTARALKD